MATVQNSSPPSFCPPTNASPFSKYLLFSTTHLNPHHLFMQLSQAFAPFSLGKSNSHCLEYPPVSLFFFTQAMSPGPSCLWSMFTLSMNSQAASVAHPRASHKPCSYWIYFSVSLPPVDHEFFTSKEGLLSSDATASCTAPHTKQLLNTMLMGGGMAQSVLLQILF